MDLTHLPSSVLLLLAQSQLGERQLRKVLCDALAAKAASDEMLTRARKVASALIDIAAGDGEGIKRLVTVLCIPTPEDAQLIEHLRQALLRAKSAGDVDRADVLSDALSDALEGRLFWQSCVKGLLSERLAPSVIPQPAITTP